MSSKKKWKRKLRQVEDRELRKTFKRKAQRPVFGFARALPKERK